MSLIQKITEKKIIENPSKPGFQIEIDSNGPQSTYRGNETYSSSEDQTYKITSLVSARLLNVIMQLDVLVSTCPELANTDLEILETPGSIKTVRAYVNQNKESFTKNLDYAIKNWAKKSNFKPATMFMDGSLDEFVSKVIDYLYARYKKRCSNPKTTNEEVITMNNTIRMLLQIEVLGMKKNITTTVD